MAKSPAFQFYPKDWLSSPHVQLMNPAEEGAYIRLLCYCWDSGDCSLPDDDGQLAMLSRLGEGWLNQSSAKIRSCFVPHPKKPGYITNTRLAAEMEKQRIWSEKSAKGGKESGRTRKKKSQNPIDTNESKGGSTKGQPGGRGLVEPNGNIASSSSSASSSSIAKKKEVIPSADAAPRPSEKAVVRSGPHAEAIRIFTSQWEAKHGEKYPFAGGRDGKAVSSMLDRLEGDVSRFAAAVTRYLADSDPFYAGHGLSKMQTGLERWLVNGAARKGRSTYGQRMDDNLAETLTMMHSIPEPK